MYIIAFLSTLAAILSLGIVGIAHAQYYPGAGGHGLGLLPLSGATGFGRSNFLFPNAAGTGRGGLGSYFGGSRYGSGFVGNGGIGIRQSGSTLANLYGLPQSLAAAPAPRSLGSMMGSGAMQYGAGGSPYGGGYFGSGLGAQQRYGSMSGSPFGDYGYFG